MNAIPLGPWLDSLATATNLARTDINAFLAITLVSLICGTLSPLVVGGRMAFFSDAMAHTVFAGAAVGVLVLIAFFPASSNVSDSEDFWIVPLMMVAFSALFGLSIGYFREATGLSADTIIGVFFALASGFGALLLPGLNKRTRFDPEAILFGSPMFARPEDLLFLMMLVLCTFGFVLFQFNSVVFSSFNPSLANSRGIRVRLSNYLFILLLAMVVNFSIRAVGMLIINAMLVVPAAAAANVTRTMRSLMLVSIISSVLCGWIGYRVAAFSQLNVGGRPIDLYPGGMIAMLLVGWFLASVFIARVRGRASVGVASCDC
ncbi:MAG: metal ABC transporter permease [Gemmataceae bacterium]